MKHVALLRGINVGGRNMLPMKHLAELFAAAGATDVVTYIQSGNVVFSASATVLKTVASKVEKAIESELDIKVPLVLRSGDELAATLKANPFLKRGVDEDFLHVMFLRDNPAVAAVKALDPKRSPGDEFAVVGRDIFLHLPNGAARTKLGVVWIDAQLKTVATQRNWRTVQKLADMSNA
jgi:uncharacterized protein (DUF1697 family)